MKTRGIMTDYYKGCRYCEVEAGEEHKEDCPLYNKPTEEIRFVNFKQLSKLNVGCLLYTSPSPRDRQKSRMPSSA